MLIQIEVQSRGSKSQVLSLNFYSLISLWMDVITWEDLPTKQTFEWKRCNQITTRQSHHIVLLFLESSYSTWKIINKSTDVFIFFLA